MRILHYNCFAGLSGDMNLGGMIDLGVNPKTLITELEKLQLHGWELKVENDIRRGISGTKATVVIDDHHHSDHHHSRNFIEIQKLINKSMLSRSVKNNAIAIFTVLAKAEGKVHNKPMEKVHFHEVGAIDSIIDIVGAAICYEQLNIDTVTASSIELGGGTVKCTHGIMPVPAPATSMILKDIPTTLGADNKECTTPTGAAILKTVVSEYNPKNSGKIIKTGFGIGQRDSKNLSNSVQIILMDTESSNNKFSKEYLCRLSTNIDDATGESISYLVEKLFEAGSLDVWQIPVYMKKNRLGNMVSAIVEIKNKDKVLNTIFKYSPTLGVREEDILRHSLKREIKTVNTEFGPIQIKLAYLYGNVISEKAEFEDVKKASEKCNVTLDDIYKAVEREKNEKNTK